MNVLVTGSRTIHKAAWVFSILDANVKSSDIVIHGGAGGVDELVRQWCKNHKVTEIVIPPLIMQTPYYLYRDAEMVGMCDKCIAIWDGMSSGTIFTYNYARRRGKPVFMFKVGDE